MFIDKFRKILEKLPIQGQTPVTYMISDQNGSTLKTANQKLSSLQICEHQTEDSKS